MVYINKMMKNRLYNCNRFVDTYIQTYGLPKDIFCIEKSYRIDHYYPILVKYAGMGHWHTIFYCVKKKYPTNEDSTSFVIGLMGGGDYNAVLSYRSLFLTNEHLPLSLPVAIENLKNLNSN